MVTKPTTRPAPRPRGATPPSPNGAAPLDLPLNLPTDLPLEWGRKVLYPDPFERRYRAGDPFGPMTAAVAKEIIGWKEEPELEKWGSDYLLFDGMGRRIRCENNVRNRPLYGSRLDELMQKLLLHRWRYNGEPVIISRTGQVLNGQHTLISLILAEQQRVEGVHKGRWREHWSTEVVLEKLVVYGVSDDDEVVNTMDTCKPRSLSDVIFRSQYLRDLTGGKRTHASNMLGAAVRMMWHRTGASVDAFDLRRTIEEQMDFLGRHKRLEQCVRHVLDENDGSKLSVLLGPGYLAALMYLMATSESLPGPYLEAPEQTEDLLDWGRLQKATDYMTLLAGSPDLIPVRDEIGYLGDEDTATKATRDEIMGVIVKGWLAWVQGKPLTREALRLRYHTNDHGVSRLIEVPTVGGIDFGNPDRAREAMGLKKEVQPPRGRSGQGGAVLAADGDPTPEEIEEAAALELAARQAETRDAARAKPKPPAGPKLSELNGAVDDDGFPVSYEDTPVGPAPAPPPAPTPRPAPRPRGKKSGG